MSLAQTFFSKYTPAAPHEANVFMSTLEIAEIFNQGEEVCDSDQINGLMKEQGFSQTLIDGEFLWVMKRA